MTLTTTLSLVATQVIAALTGGTQRTYRVVAFIDDFAIDKSTLKTKHKNQLDRWVSGDKLTSGVPLRPGDTSTRITRVVGMASRTGPETHNVELARQRAQRVYNYLATELDADQLADDVSSVGSSEPRPGFDEPGSEHSENRAVAVEFEYDIELIGVAPYQPPPPSTPPPTPLSQQWSLSVEGYGSASDPLPIIDIVGAQLLTGKLRNRRTMEERRYWLAFGGLQLGVSVAPAELGFNEDNPTFVDFVTRAYVDFDDFDYTGVIVLGGSASVSFQASEATFMFPMLAAHVEPDTAMITSNVAASIDGQGGIFLVLDP